MLANKNFLPNDDQSEFEVGLRAPEGTSLEATEIIANRHRHADPPAAGGRLHAGDVGDDPAQTQNLGTVYVRLKPLEERVARSVRGHGRRSARTCCRSSRRRTCAPACGRSRRSAAAATRTPRSSSPSTGRTWASSRSTPTRSPTAAQEGAGRRRRRHLAERRQAGALGAARSAEGGGPRRARSRTRPRRCGCWSAATRSRPTTKGASSTRCTSAPSQGDRADGRGDRAADGAVDAARQRAAREHRATHAGHGAVRHQPPQPAAPGHGLRGPAAGRVADAGDGRDDRTRPSR